MRRLPNGNDRIAKTRIRTLAEIQRTLYEGIRPRAGSHTRTRKRNKMEHGARHVRLVVVLLKRKEQRTMIIFNSVYEKGFQAGVNAQMLADKEAQNHRLEDMLRRGKEIGYNEGFVEGYTKGHEVGYAEGEFDYKARNGIVEIDGDEFEAVDDDELFEAVEDDIAEALGGGE